jgi:hypothetical protein
LSCDDWRAVDLHAGRQGEASPAPLLGGGDFEELDGEISAAWALMGVRIRFGE